jgi:DNA-binding response OmpR family regulator
MPTLLLVEDDASNRLTLSVLLEDLGFEVTEAETYEQAEGLLRAQPFDAVILDRGLGTRDGVTLAPVARACCQNVRVIVLSGGDPTTSSAPDVDAWIVKGGGLSSLVEALTPGRKG